MLLLWGKRMYWWTELLEEVFEDHATEVYLTAGGGVLKRISGALQPARCKPEPLSSSDIEHVVTLLLSTDQQIQLEFENFVLTRYVHEKIGRCRVVVTRQRNTYSVTLRLYHSAERLQAYPITKTLENLTRIQEGLIVIGGLAHSGRSTICAQLMMHINDERPSYMVSLEQTLSYLMPHRKALINQREVGLDIPSYHEGIRACVYENADVIVIDDYTDSLAVDEALTLAMQGRLVIFTLKAKNASQAMQQLLATGDPQHAAYRRHLLQSALRAIVIQQLIVDQNDLLLPLYEVVYNNQAVQSLIETGTVKSINDVILRYTKMGMCDFDTSLAELVLANRISKNRALTMIDSMTNFEMALAKALP